MDRHYKAIAILACLADTKNARRDRVCSSNLTLLMEV